MVRFAVVSLEQVSVSCDARDSEVFTAVSKEPHERVTLWQGTLWESPSEVRRIGALKDSVKVSKKGVIKPYCLLRFLSPVPVLFVIRLMDPVICQALGLAALQRKKTRVMFHRAARIHKECANPIGACPRGQGGT